MKRTDHLNKSATWLRLWKDQSVLHPESYLSHSKRQFAMLVSIRLRRTVEAQLFSKESGSGNTAACRTFCSCWEHIHEHASVTAQMLIRICWHCTMKLRAAGFLLTCCWGNSFGWLWWWKLLLLSHSFGDWTDLWLKNKIKAVVITFCPHGGSRTH